MIVLLFIYVLWFFFARWLIMAVPALRFLDYVDETFLVCAAAYVYRHRALLSLHRRFWNTCLVVVGLFIVSFLLNLSSPKNFLLILSSYMKPIALWAVLLIVLKTSEERGMALSRFFQVLFVLQIPLLILQFLAGGATMAAVDDMVGTFGFEGSMELGYLAGVIACASLPGVFVPERRKASLLVFLTATTVALLTSSKQVVLLIFISGVLFFLLFKSRRARTVFAFAMLALIVLFGAREALKLEVFSVDYQRAFDVLQDLQSTRKVEGLLTTYAIFDAHPQDYLIGTGPGMYTSFVALNAETEYAKVVNYAYYLQKSGETEEGLGGTFNQSSSSFLSLVGEVGIPGLLGFMALVWYPFSSLRRSRAGAELREIAFASALFVSLGMVLQNLFEGGVAINFFWALNAHLLYRAEQGTTEEIAETT